MCVTSRRGFYGEFKLVARPGFFCPMGPTGVGDECLLSSLFSYRHRLRRFKLENAAKFFA